METNIQIYIGSTLWNGLTDLLRNITSIVLFKENYKSFEMSIFFSSIIQGCNLILGGKITYIFFVFVP